MVGFVPSRGQQTITQGPSSSFLFAGLLPTLLSMFTTSLGAMAVPPLLSKLETVHSSDIQNRAVFLDRVSCDGLDVANKLLCVCVPSEMERGLNLPLQSPAFCPESPDSGKKWECV